MEATTETFGEHFISQHTRFFCDKCVEFPNLLLSRFKLMAFRYRAAADELPNLICILKVST